MGVRERGWRVLMHTSTHKFITLLSKYCRVCECVCVCERDPKPAGPNFSRWGVFARFISSKHSTQQEISTLITWTVEFYHLLHFKLLALSYITHEVQISDKFPGVIIDHLLKYSGPRDHLLPRVSILQQIIPYMLIYSVEELAIMIQDFFKPLIHREMNWINWF